MPRLEKLHPNDSATLAQIEQAEHLFFEGSSFEEDQWQGDVYTLTVNDAIIGYAIFGQVHLPESKVGFITRVAVYPQYRRQGYGRFMVHTAVKKMFEAGSPYIYAGILKSNRASKTMFAQCGWHPFEELGYEFEQEVDPKYDWVAIERQP